jgi:hypothetical protein
MKAHKMTRIKLKTPKFQNTITKYPQSSQEERQIPLLLPCETPYRKIEDPKTIRRKLKTPELQIPKEKTLKVHKKKGKYPFSPFV